MATSSENGRRFSATTVLISNLATLCTSLIIAFVLGLSQFASAAEVDQLEQRLRAIEVEAGRSSEKTSELLRGQQQLSNDIEQLRADLKELSERLFPLTTR